jgi:hypothetical protein
MRWKPGDILVTSLTGMPTVRIEILATDRYGHLWRYPDVPENQYHSANSNDPFFMYWWRKEN